MCVGGGGVRPIKNVANIDKLSGGIGITTKRLRGGREVYLRGF